MVSSCIYREPISGRTDTQNHGQTDTRMDRQKLKTEGPKILSNDIFFFRTVIIGGPIWKHHNSKDTLLIKLDKYNWLKRMLFIVCGQTWLFLDVFVAFLGKLLVTHTAVLHPSAVRLAAQFTHVQISGETILD